MDIQRRPMLQPNKYGPQFSTENFLSDSVGQFAKFRSLPQQNCPNSMAHYGFLFVSKFSYVQFIKFHY